MTKATFDVRDLAQHWPEVVARALAGEEVIVTQGDSPRVRLVPLGIDGPRTAGLHVGAIQTRDDFDAPLADEFWTGAL